MVGVCCCRLGLGLLAFRNRGPIGRERGGATTLPPYVSRPNR